MLKSGRVPAKSLEAPPLSHSTLPSVDSELICVLSKTVEDIGLDWSAPEEPAHGLLDEWQLKRQQSSYQWPALFLLAVHEELTKTLRAPYLACVNTSTSAALTTIDGAEDRDYSNFAPLEEVVAAHMCPPSALGLKAHVAMGFSIEALQDDIGLGQQDLCSSWPGLLSTAYDGGTPGVPGQASPKHGRVRP